MTAILVGCLGALAFAGAPTAFAAANGPKPEGSPNPPTLVLSAPVRLAQTHRGDLIVSDHGTGMILTLDRRTLAVADGFAIDGQPAGVAVTGRGAKARIFVGNTTSKRVEVYDQAGQWQYNLGGAKDYVWQPTDIAIDEDRGFVFVVDGRRKVVRIFSEAGLVLGAIPTVNPDPNLLANPTGIAVDPARQEVFVSDYGDPALYIRARVQVFDYAGTLLRTISGRAGMLGSRFSRPQGLAVDLQGNVLVVDCVSGEVLMFDSVAGVHLKTLGGFGTAPGQLQFPLDVVLDSASGDVFVSNNDLGRIELFPEGGVLP